MPPKSIYRQPGARHFLLVHRSQRDPLINDPAASQHVLKPVFRGKARQELEELIDPDDLAHDLMRANIGEAANYGIYYDDTEYDYMQHLRPFGIQEDGVESTLIEAMARSGRPVAAKKIASGGVAASSRFLRDIPLEALASAIELTHEEVLSAQAAVPAGLAGLQPDMDPHLRQTLEALEDDAFVDSSFDDNFFAELVAKGERDSEDEPFAFVEDDVDNIKGIADEQGKAIWPGITNDNGSWESRFAKFKTEGKASEDQTSDMDRFSEVHSEREDTLGQLPTLKVIGVKRQKKTTSIASGNSMSSSSMYRNENLTLLDERYDYVEKEYATDVDEFIGEDDEAPELITSRGDFNEILDDFLDNYEILRGKVRPALDGDTHEEKLGTIRKSLREPGYESNHCPGDDLFYEHDEDDGTNLWDCETILSTCNNRTNRPKLIRMTETKFMPDAHVGSKTRKAFVKKLGRSTDMPSDNSRTAELSRVPVTFSRASGESKGEKRIRKLEVKKERHARRVEKKSNRERFAGEKKALKALASTPSIGIRKL